MIALTNKIKQKAFDLGFHKVGIVPAEPLSEEGGKLRDWLNKDFHGEMAWMAREPEKRIDPAAIFPEVKSVIVAALNYYTSHKHGDDPAKGKISRYAWGDDYHEIVREKLGRLLDWISSENTAARGKICVDTSPTMDKAWAVRAGLGWLGKHSNVITKNYGSWIFIGEILLNLELVHTDKIVEDHCGSCTACLDACPTQAIVEPYVVDSRKCISYASIELRSETLPEEISANLNGWIYGCDICQDVCPWNRFEQPTQETGFEPRFGETSLELVETASLLHDNYIERFRGSTIKRTKLNGLQRNAKALLQFI